ncbi:class I SAM-dependent DNA methyltransferase [Pseudofrankia inefficax]|uniref:Methyltransferase type 11 n=1 Tax=Pseudofrankia inefficax (strain DSM 45817 / CECT 9037 / DDB 130130 / EuI1c) TaxID=298654 RepID=E3J2Y6_PSEI1|nr:class I SAM-dependent methyltransferase [Pseudofrankia inefficax]ADP82936.1 Methyltransferase type 11 [Pseudofrankia inefficax]
MGEPFGGWAPAEYGDRIADVYDHWYEGLDEALPAAVELLAKTAKGGQALELGIGTGRVALPLAAAGVKVAGVDASERMVARLWAKPGGADIPVTFGDFGDPAVLAEAAGTSGDVSLVYVVFNTLFALPTQAEQVRVFAAASEVLAPGAAFVVQAFVPDQSLFARGTRFSTDRIEGDESRLTAAVHDRNAQTVRANHVVLSPRGIETYPVNLRYAFPAELDLMAALAGLTLEARFGTWSGEPFTNTSGSHISLWRKLA